ncbi:RNA-splicing ligase RtcB [Marinobacter salinus]|uniref:tRNA-splicing ligase RtcB n=1 Tax=Marinobacter salinus TaxID=1874317 RepID=A0A1D9GJE5_9GAMM|nr:RtcB family protein [Marinobacter salinus]AOY87654.1 RNA-splicing ligase RtcB [Marinobacter salinus]
MDMSKLLQRGDYEWELPKQGSMRVPGILYASRRLIETMDNKVLEQVRNVATLPGIVGASYAMPDAHWGYGFPIGGVAAFDPEEGGVVSAGGVGFDISCGVRLLRTGLALNDVRPVLPELMDALFNTIPAGVGSCGQIHLNDLRMSEMLRGGARWSVEQGWGRPEDLERIEENGRMAGARPENVSRQARRRQCDEMGTLGSGNHYLEVQYVEAVMDREIAASFGLRTGEVVVSIHCGSRGLGHQIGTEFLIEMAKAAKNSGIPLADRELACAPATSTVGQLYLGAMRAATNCAFANREIISHLARQTFSEIMPGAKLPLLYDVSHNTCKEETHLINGKETRLLVHRKGATRAFGPGHSDLPPAFRESGQPVLIGGSMGTASYVLAGLAENESKSLGSACHGSGRAMSRRQARRLWQGRKVVDDLRGHGIHVRSPSMRGVAEEAPDAYKDVDEVAKATECARLARRVARLRPLGVVKG